LWGCEAFFIVSKTVFTKDQTSPAVLRECPPAINFDSAKLGQLCRQRGIVRLDLFGSALRPDFKEDSDVDLLASLHPDAHPTLLDWADIQERLAAIFGRSVDLVSRRAIERSKNKYRKKAILSTVLPIYVEG
jgi:predicted nucleotidyltransferase